MSFYSAQIGSRTKGFYAVKLSEGYQIYLDSETSLKRLREVFPGALVYVRTNGSWIKTEELDDIVRDIERNKK